MLSDNHTIHLVSTHPPYSARVLLELVTCALQDALGGLSVHSYDSAVGYRAGASALRPAASEFP